MNEQELRSRQGGLCRAREPGCAFLGRIHVLVLDELLSDRLAAHVEWAGEADGGPYRRGGADGKSELRPKRALRRNRRVLEEGCGNVQVGRSKRSKAIKRIAHSWSGFLRARRTQPNVCLATSCTLDILRLGEVTSKSEHGTFTAAGILFVSNEIARVRPARTL